jgi:glucose/arabinose dehydrogenase
VPSVQRLRVPVVLLCSSHSAEYVARRLADVKVVYRQHGPASRGNHFGSRIVQANDGNLFVTNGEHFTDRDMAQTFDNDLGISPAARYP